MSDDITTWFENHATDYQTVLGRLERTRSVLLDGDISNAADVLEKSYVFAVLSIQTERDRHERAFTAHYAGDLSLKEAALETVYGGNKKNWLRRTFDSTDWASLARAVRCHAKAERWDVLLDTVVENLTGVAHRKGAFMLAMSGLYEFGCIDSNVARYAELSEEEGDSLSFNSAEAYMNTCDEVFNTVPTDLPLFVKQWAIYDFERGEHSRHNAFYAELPIRSDR
jgi:hypothetical protein